ncbi:uncharacterized protein Fot_14150 [Forsythia ovata]|uniref:Uncharacterized protein n=1 Tax=Forsythia ovata TaxID=205694 RepID=A0ABD1W5I0_9LAMI
MDPRPFPFPYARIGVGTNIKIPDGNKERERPTKPYLVPNETCQHPEFIMEEPQSGKRKRTKAVIEEIETLRFQLFKSTIKDKDDECFILQMHKIQAVHAINYKLSIHEKDGKKEVEKANRCLVGELEMVPVTEETCGLLVDTKYNLPLQERLVGWTSEVRKRSTPSNITDKYYNHEKVGKNFRSLPEVGTFILFNTIPKYNCKGKKKKEENNLENKDEDVVPLSEENASQGDDEDIFAEILKNPIVNL